MTRQRKSLGAAGEKMAADFLRGRGYRILESNYCSPLGEIDIVAKEKDTLCFIEVKTRLSLHRGSPFEAVTLPKQRKISQMAAVYLQDRRLNEVRARFDVVGISRDAQGRFRIELVRDAFESAIDR